MAFVLIMLVLHIKCHAFIILGYQINRFGKWVEPGEAEPRAEDDLQRGEKRTRTTMTRRLAFERFDLGRVGVNRIELGAGHDRREDRERDRFEGEKNQENDRCWRRPACADRPIGLDARGDVNDQQNQRVDRYDTSIKLNRKKHHKLKKLGKCLRD